MTHAREVWAHDEIQLTRTIDSLVMQGFAVASREAASVTMVKRKTFSMVWAVVGFFLCVLPLFIYLIVYAFEQDQVVFIRIANPAPLGGGGGLPQLSADRRFWWDGVVWRDANALPPPGAQWTPDHTMWWDGTAWRPVRPAIEG